MICHHRREWRGNLRLGTPTSARATMMPSYDKACMCGSLQEYTSTQGAPYSVSYFFSLPTYGIILVPEGASYFIYFMVFI